MQDQRSFGFGLKIAALLAASLVSAFVALLYVVFPQTVGLGWLMSAFVVVSLVLWYAEKAKNLGGYSNAVLVVSAVAAIWVGIVLLVMAFIPLASTAKSTPAKSVSVPPHFGSPGTVVAATSAKLAILTPAVPSIVEVNAQGYGFVRVAAETDQDYRAFFAYGDGHDDKVWAAIQKCRRCWSVTSVTATTVSSSKVSDLELGFQVEVIEAR
jgi:hypothetical protein